ncbi:MAG: peptidoglycan bridge formation glycyltransferase FemA/FemB family protein [Erysipelotrichaceae bacterium]|nr:peptidoglycan bridge formation glycyltransferase FemA/FemB family protein [Erysipelotrichaceae bacterium]
MIKEIDPKTFDEYTRDHPQITFYQTSGWGRLKSFTGWKSLYLSYEKDGETAYGLFLLKKMPLIRAYLAYCPRGFLIDYGNTELLHSFQQELIPFLKKKGCFELIIDPYYPCQERDINGDPVEGGFDHRPVVDDLISLGYEHLGYNLHYENLQPRWLFRLDIRRPYSELEKDFRYEARRRSRKKDFLAITTRELSKEEIPVFKRLMEDTAKRRGFLDRSLAYYEQMYEALHDEGILRYMVAEIDCVKARNNVLKEIDTLEKRIAKLSLHTEKNAGRIKEEEVTLNSQKNLLAGIDACEKEYGAVAPLSVVALLCRGREAIMLLAGNNEDYLQHFNTSNIIVTDLIRLAQSEGYDYYNFYGISGDFSEDNPDYGLYLYKRQYGGEVLELLGQFEYTINRLTRNLYEILLKVYRLTKR